MEKFFCAVDIGTTTVAVTIIDRSGIVLARSGFLNPQKAFGSDVISRITNAKKPGFLESMKNILLEELETCVSSMIADCICGPENQKNDVRISDHIEKICIAANTVMASIVLGKDISEMGLAPFPMPFHENVTVSMFDTETLVLAGASAFLGADSILGAISLNLSEGEILMDLGTNGEIILCSKNAYHAATAACGPAFENCTRSRGIHGATTLQAVSRLIRTGKLKRDGILTEDFLTNGLDTEINGTAYHLTADILREIQLAVSAVISTLFLLIEDAGLKKEQVNRLYLSGGFGFYMNLSDAVNLGLIPENLLEKAVISGNTSLKGAEKILSVPESLQAFENLRRQIILHQYGGDDRYQDLFIRNLTFEKRGL